jgi:putative membrane protein
MQLKKNNRLTKIAIFMVVLLIGVITCINPVYPKEQFLQHLGSLLLLVILWTDIRKNRYTIFAYSFFATFIVIHIIGARYIYTYVPYTEWINSLFDGLSKEPIIMEKERNGYDRFVHLAFGILVFPIIYESLNFRNIKNEGLVVAFSWTLIQTISMLYEVFEWWLTLVLSPEAANDYNGQQGDIWDAQKDMVLALVGSTLMAILYLILIRTKRYSDVRSQQE